MSVNSETERVPTPTYWTDDRVAEFQMLQRLLNEVTLINRGSHVIERIQVCESIAAQLSGSDWFSRRKSFMSFLSDVIISDRFPERETPEQISIDNAPGER